ncbi:signal peptide peptidase SppA [Rickettsiales endosymbiont of Stachyamoeba lipophora]|uniref:signal peptide peptidase SppA n=1 Tax=Rickettsiales endosymbiont of Stachyamoeba lipophora TaxID=2486578 RepID=UPI000F6525C5|nr:signal peptide peptidase SppA [Rickettsiales endosymbiont of Stachyamoeba lipophora]AZL15829.1 signal peptide peptidase SppA [Rickettsiales endosymbiont of Stachyamoeba lipophora]
MHLFKHDLLEDNLALRRKILAAKIIIVLLFITLLLSPLGNQKTMKPKFVNYIARLKIEDEIVYDHERINRLAQITEDKQIKAVILHINSPGGTIGGSEAYYRVLKKIAATKPLIIVMNEVAASGGYLIALAGERIYALETTYTGSIGVRTEAIEVTELAAKLGIKLHSFKTSELKAAPNPFEKVSQRVAENVQYNLEEGQRFFVKLVQENRKLTSTQLAKATNGSVFMGSQALRLGLIDEIGDEETALQFLKTTHKLDYNTLDYQIEVPKHEIEQLLRRFKSKITSLLSTKSQIMATR